MAVKYETELYPAVKAFFVGRGYDVKAEVRGCDIVAVRGDETAPTIVELKKTFTLPLLLQGADRQRTGAKVWLAVERNRARRGAHNQRFSELASLCRRLGLGMMTVTMYKTKAPVIDVWCEPADSVAGYGGKKPSAALAAAEAQASYASGPAVPDVPAIAASGGRRKGTTKLLQEFAARSGDYNVGGSTRRKLVTAYREKALQCALALRCRGPSAPRDVRAMTGCPNASHILRDNTYGWFARVQKGVYRLTDFGAAALLEYAEVAAVWTARFPWAAERELAEASELIAAAEHCDDVSPAAEDAVTPIDRQNRR